MYKLKIAKLISEMVFENIEEAKKKQEYYRDKYGLKVEVIHVTS